VSGSGSVTGLDGDRLTGEEIWLVWQRAAELDRLAAVPEVAVDSAAVEDAAVEAGMTPHSVRTALAELRLGILGGSGRARQRRPNPRDRR
jgi:hypothetical protein